MKHITVVGKGPCPQCGGCADTVALIEQVAREKGAAIALEMVEDVQKLGAYRIMATPGVLIDGWIVHVGGVPSCDKVEQWF